MRFAVASTRLLAVLMSLLVCMPSHAQDSYPELEAAQREKDQAQQAYVDRENAWIEYEEEDQRRRAAEQEPDWVMDILLDRHHTSHAEEDDDGFPIVAVALVALAAWIVYEVYTSEPPERLEEPGTPQQPTSAAKPSLAGKDDPSLTEWSVTRPNAHRNEVAAPRPTHVTTGFREAVMLVIKVMFMSIAGLLLLSLACTWMLFRKAGVGGWKALVPIYNWWTFLRVAGMEGWLCLVPGLNLLLTVFVAPFQLARQFGRSSLFGMGLAFAGIIFYPVLAFGRTRYVGKLGD